MSRKLPPGHRWAYLGVALGLAASVAGNVANTVLTEASSPLELRIPFAVIWPVFTGIGIEVLTRVQWQRNWRHWGARAFLMGPMTLVAAFVSYLHLRHLMILSGEPGLAQGLGPLAVDGTLLGCTVALLVTRHVSRGLEGAAGMSLAERVANVRATVLDVKAAAAGQAPELPAPVSPAVALAAPVSPAPLSLAPVSPAPVSTDVTDTRERKTRGGWDVGKAVALILEGELSPGDIADTVGVGVRQLNRIIRAEKLLRANPRATVPAEWKVPVAAVRALRAELTR